MASFNNLALTSKGMKALLEAQAGTTLTLSKIGMGSGSTTGNAAAMTALVTPQVMLPISESKVEASGYLTIVAKMTNESITQGFNWCETGLFFTDADGNDVLFAYACTTTKYDYVPAYSDQRYVKHIRIANIITDSNNITISESQGLLYVDTLTFEQYQDEVTAALADKVENDTLFPNGYPVYVSRWNEHGGSSIVTRSLIETITDYIQNKKILNGEFTFFNITYSDAFDSATAYGLVRYYKHLDEHVTVYMVSEKFGTDEYVARFVVGETTWNEPWSKIFNSNNIVISDTEPTDPRATIWLQPIS